MSHVAFHCVIVVALQTKEWLQQNKTVVVRLTRLVFVLWSRFIRVANLIPFAWQGGKIAGNRRSQRQLEVIRGMWRNHFTFASVR